jgi:hypothetical protein
MQMPSCAPLVSIVPAVRPLARTVWQPLACAALQLSARTVQRSFDGRSEGGQSWSAERADSPGRNARGLGDRIGRRNLPTQGAFTVAPREVGID